ncbi:MAG: prepilin-type N-terminal cleavage/methylation domain-containing protein [bacterium]
MIFKFKKQINGKTEVRPKLVSGFNQHLLFSKKVSAGFTIIELILAMFIATIIMAGATGFFKNIFQTSKDQVLLLNNLDSARIALLKFTDEIRNSTYGNDGSYPINSAGNSQVVFFTSSGGSTTTSKRVRYYLSGTTLYKGVVMPSGSPSVYNLSSEAISNVATGIQNGSSTLFYYYDGNYAGSSTPLAQPVNINQIKFVTMNLILNRQNNNVASSTYNISGGANIRNLKINLGN